MQFNPVAGSAGGLHVAEDAGTGQGGFQQMPPARMERSPAALHRFAGCLSGIAGQARRNRVGVEDLQLPAPRFTRQGRLAAPVRTGHNVERRHRRKRRPTDSGGLPIPSLDDRVPVPGPGNPGAVGPDTAERSAGLDLGREVGPDPVAPVLPSARHVRRRRSRDLVLVHVAELTPDHKRHEHSAAELRWW